MDTTLIVARMDPTNAESVAGIFAESDKTELPRELGVRERALFQFHGLYMHLIRSTEVLHERLEQVRRSSLFQDVNNKLKPYIDAYDPATWAGPRDAMATCFYNWHPDE